MNQKQLEKDVLIVGRLLNGSNKSQKKQTKWWVEGDLEAQKTLERDQASNTH